jgi:4-amino-4-deoxy-L-arabinose transferase-like glycosyltransferase
MPEICSFQHFFSTFFFYLAVKLGVQFAQCKYAILNAGELANYRARGGEWWGGIAATLHFYMVSAVRKGINE